MMLVLYLYIVLIHQTLLIQCPINPYLNIIECKHCVATCEADVIYALISNQLQQAKIMKNWLLLNCNGLEYYPSTLYHGILKQEIN